MVEVRATLSSGGDRFSIPVFLGGPESDLFEYMDTFVLDVKVAHPLGYLGRAACKKRKVPSDSLCKVALLAVLGGEPKVLGDSPDFRLRDVMDSRRRGFYLSQGLPP